MECRRAISYFAPAASLHALATTDDARHRDFGLESRSTFVVCRNISGTPNANDEAMTMWMRLLFLLGVVGGFVSPHHRSHDVRRASVMEEVYPSLQPWDWQLRDRCRCEPFFSSGHDFPVVAFEREGRYLASPFRMDDAVTNLRRADQATWEPAVGDPALDPFILLASGTDHAAEQILDSDFLRQAQTSLESSGLLLAIPQRGTLLACSNDADDAVKTVFYFLAEDLWRNGDTIRLTRLIFLCDNGTILGALPPPPRRVKHAYDIVDKKFKDTADTN